MSFHNITGIVLAQSKKRGWEVTLFVSTLLMMKGVCSPSL